MSEEVDLIQLAKLIDAALGSKNPSVKKALRNFLLVASIAESENEDTPAGPFQDYLVKVDELGREVSHIQSQLAHKNRNNSDHYYSANTWSDYSTTSLRSTSVDKQYTDLVNRLRGTES